MGDKTEGIKMYGAEVNKALIEEISPGSSITVVNGGMDEQQERAFIHITKNIIDLVSVNAVGGGWPPLDSLRAVVVSSDLDTEVRRWQDQLKRPAEGASKNVFGKTFSWSRGPNGPTYAIIVLDACVAVASLNGKWRNLAVSTITHEIGHTIWDQVYFAAFGEEKWPAPFDWPPLRQFIANSTVSESFANMIASRLVSQDEFLEEHTTLAKEVLARALNDIEDMANECSINDKAAICNMWCRSVTSLSSVFTQLGRSMWRCNPWDETLNQKLVAAIAGVSSQWGN